MHYRDVTKIEGIDIQVGPHPLAPGLLCERESLDFAYRAWGTEKQASPFGEMYLGCVCIPGVQVRESGWFSREEGIREWVQTTANSFTRYRRVYEPFLQPPRFEYIDGRLAQILEGVHYHHLFVCPQRPGEEAYSVGVPRIMVNAGNYILSREARDKEGNIRREYPDPAVWALLRPVVLQDIKNNYWGPNDHGNVYLVAYDIANAAFPGTWPAYQPGGLPLHERESWLDRSHPFFEQNRFTILESPVFTREGV